MVKVFWMLKRKPGITHAQFRAHYETIHSRLADDYFGHLMIGYRRNYVENMFGSTESSDGRFSFGPIEREWDCIAEWIMEDEAAFDEINAILAQPEVGAIFSEDQTHFMDSSTMTLVRVEVVDDVNLTLQIRDTGR